MRRLLDEILGVLIALWIVVAVFVLPLWWLLGCSDKPEAKTPGTPTTCRDVTRADLSVRFLREAAVIVETGACKGYVDVSDCPALQPAIQRHEQRREEWRKCQP